MLEVNCGFIATVVGCGYRPQLSICCGPYQVTTTANIILIAVDLMLDESRRLPTGLLFAVCMA